MLAALVLAAVLAVLLVIDLAVVRGRGDETAHARGDRQRGVGRRGARVLRRAARRGDGERAQAFLAGYLVEKSLSLDNVFVFLLVFSAFALPVAERHRILTYGIVLALVLRGVFIVAGAAALSAVRLAELRVRRVPDLDAAGGCSATATTTTPSTRSSAG